MAIHCDQPCGEMDQRIQEIGTIGNSVYYAVLNGQIFPITMDSIDTWAYIPIEWPPPPTPNTGRPTLKGLLSYGINVPTYVTGDLLTSICVRDVLNCRHFYNVFIHLCGRFQILATGGGTCMSDNSEHIILWYFYRLEIREKKDLYGYTQ